MERVLNSSKDNLSHYTHMLCDKRAMFDILKNLKNPKHNAKRKKGQEEKLKKIKIKFKIDKLLCMLF